MRKRKPDQLRPYKIWGHPLMTLLLILFSAFYLGMTVDNDINNYLHNRQPVVNSLPGIVITLPGVPLYFYFKRRK